MRPFAGQRPSNMPAQGNALGYGHQKVNQAPTGRHKPRSTPGERPASDGMIAVRAFERHRVGCAALSGLARCGGHEPRALPWAGLWTLLRRWEKAVCPKTAPLGIFRQALSRFITTTILCGRFVTCLTSSISSILNVSKRACCREQKCSGFDFIADEFGQARVVRFQALEEKQERIVPAPFEFVADSADLLQVAMRVGDENPCA